MNAKVVISGICTAILMLAPLKALSWGQKGHDVTCAIAARHLSPKARRHLDKVLDGKSIVYWANWMDNASHTPEYSYTKTWHYKNIDAGETYDSAALNPDGDVVTAIDTQVKAIMGGNLTKEQEALAVRMIVHFVGDLHCPMHLGHKSDAGGNKRQIQFFGRGRNLHSIWDSDIVEGIHKWSCSEWAEEIDTVSGKEIKEIVKGTPYEWGRQTYEITTAIYDATPSGAKLSYNYESEWAGTVERQLLYGGLRLASVLNMIYK